VLIPFGKLPVGSINGIIHVGAHEGEELDGYVAAGKSSVLWVEANPEKWHLLSEKISGHKGMRLGRFAASSSTGGSAVLNVASNGQSSSLLPLGAHCDSYPNISYVSEVCVDLRSVDDWMEHLDVDPAVFNFVNLDIQGYELIALEGMARQLRYVDYVYSEVNFKDVYIGCAKVDELDAFLSGYGLKRVATVKAGDEGWGDALYSRKSNLGLRIWVFLGRVSGLAARCRGGAKRALKRLASC